MALFVFSAQQLTNLLREKIEQGVRSGWSPSAAYTNDKTLLVIHSHQLTKHFTREMDRFWESAELGITPRIRQKLEWQRAKCGREVERGWEGRERREKVA